MGRDEWCRTRVRVVTALTPVWTDQSVVGLKSRTCTAGPRTYNGTEQLVGSTCMCHGLWIIVGVLCTETVT